MANKLSRTPSPILEVTGSMIKDESSHLIGNKDQVPHSFTVDIAAIEPDPNQPRRHFNEATLKDMAESYKTVGLLQPLLLRKHPEVRRRWIIVSGERRWRAAQIAGWSEITAIETSRNIAEAMLIENLQRSDLTVVEEGRALQRLIQSQNWSHERCADALGIDPSRISAALHVLGLPSDFLDAITSGTVVVPRNVLVELARIRNIALRDRLIAMAREERLTIRTLRVARKAEEKGARNNESKQALRKRRDSMSSSMTNMMTCLKSLRQAGSELSADEKHKLIALRQAIDVILGSEH